MRDNKKYMNLNSLDEKTKGGDINWTDLLLKIWHIRKKVGRAIVWGIVIGLVMGFSIPKQYGVTVVLSPELGSSKGGGGLASLASSFFGNIGHGGNDALNALLAPEIVSSTPFLLDLLDIQIKDEKANKNTSLSEYLDSQSVAWWKYVLALPRMAIDKVKSFFVDKKENTSSPSEEGVIHLSEKQITQINVLRTKLLINVDKKANIITLDVSLQDPVITATVADSVVSKLQEYIVNYQISKAKDDLKYWELLYNENKEKYYNAQKEYADYIDSNNNVILHSSIVERERLQNELSLALQGYSQVSQQLQLAKAKVQESKPAFTVVEPAVVPLYPNNISKLTLLIICIMLTVTICIGWEFYGIKYFKDLKQNFSSSKN